MHSHDRDVAVPVVLTGAAVAVLVPDEVNVDGWLGFLGGGCWDAAEAVATFVRE